MLKDTGKSDVSSIFLEYDNAFWFFCCVTIFSNDSIQVIFAVTLLLESYEVFSSKKVSPEQLFRQRPSIKNVT